jgi:hypothetical protein
MELLSAVDSVGAIMSLPPPDRLTAMLQVQDQCSTDQYSSLYAAL